MKIEFEDRSFIEITKSSDYNKIIISISARDHQNALKKITNTTELTLDQLKELFNSVLS